MSWTFEPKDIRPADLDGFAVSSAEPGTPSEGDVWVDTATFTFKVYLEGEWRPVGSDPDVTLVVGSATSVLPLMSQDVAGSSVTVVTGTAVQTLPSLTQSAAGWFTVTGTAAQTLPALTQDAAGTATETVTGTAVQTLPALTQDAAGTVTAP